MYEHHRQPLLPRRAFLGRLARHVALAGAVVGAALLVGVLGYHLLEGLPWLDALLNASMILGGMGPVDRLNTNGGKLFASLYALFSGLVFISAAGILLAPVAHRMLHKVHADRV
jgi:hypothetical protein